MLDCKILLVLFMIAHTALLTINTSSIIVCMQLYVMENIHAAGGWAKQTHLLV